MQKTTKRLLKDNRSHLEDMAMKTAAQYFGEELLAWLGEEKPLRVAPNGIKLRIDVVKVGYKK